MLVIDQLLGELRPTKIRRKNLSNVILFRRRKTCCNKESDHTDSVYAIRSPSKGEAHAPHANDVGCVLESPEPFISVVEPEPPRPDILQDIPHCTLERTFTLRACLNKVAQDIDTEYRRELSFPGAKVHGSLPLRPNPHPSNSAPTLIPPTSFLQPEEIPDAKVGFRNLLTLLSLSKFDADCQM